MRASTWRVMALGPAVFLAVAVAAGPGDLDTTFDGDGMLTTEIVGATSTAHSLLVQEDHKIVVVGTAGGGFALARYLEDGSLDTTFGLVDQSAVGKRLGYVQTSFGAAPEAWDVVRQPDGKYIVCGHDGSTMVLVRYTIDGIPDGQVFTPFHVPVAGYAIERRSSDGSFVVGGYVEGGDGSVVTGLLHFDGNGLRDLDFGTNGVAETPSHGLAGPVGMVQLPDERIVTTVIRDGASNDVFGIVRFSKEGALDTFFGGTGVASAPVPLGTATGVARQSDGKLVVVGQALAPFGGSFTAAFGIARFGTEGTVDTTFGNAGVVVTPFPEGGGLQAAAHAVSIADDGKILVVGELFDVNGAARFAVARYLSDGRLDYSFGTCGRRVLDWGGRGCADACALDASDRLVVAGSASIRPVPDFAVARLLLDGTRDGSACADGAHVRLVVGGALPSVAGAPNRATRKVAHKLAKLLGKAAKDADAAARKTGKAHDRSVAKARSDLEKLRGVAGKADDKGNLGANLAVLSGAVDLAIFDLYAGVVPPAPASGTGHGTRR